VGNNPISFNDPTGHRACDSAEDCKDMVIKPNGNSRSYNELMSEKDEPDVKDPKNLDLSQSGEDFIFFWEGGWSAVPFNDASGGTGDCTIGYGHKLHDGPCDGRDKYWRDNPISEATARSWAYGSIAIAEEIIEDTVKVPLTQSQFDMLVSYIYNSGGQPGNWYQDKGIPELLNNGNYYEAALVIDSGPYYQGDWYRPGLEKRRHEESAMFLFGP